MKVFSPAINFKLMLLLVVAAWVAVGAPLSSSGPLIFVLAGAVIQLVSVKAKNELMLGSKGLLILLAVAALLTFGSSYLAESSTSNRIADLGWGTIGYAICGLLVGALRKSADPNRHAES